MKLTNVLALGKDFWGKAFEEWECVCGAVVAVPGRERSRAACRRDARQPRLAALRRLMRSYDLDREELVCSGCRTTLPLSRGEPAASFGVAIKDFATRHAQCGLVRGRRCQCCEQWVPTEPHAAGCPELSDIRETLRGVGPLPATVGRAPLFDFSRSAVSPLAALRPAPLPAPDRSVCAHCGAPSEMTCGAGHSICRNCWDPTGATKSHHWWCDSQDEDDDDDAKYEEYKLRRR